MKTLNLATAGLIFILPIGATAPVFANEAFDMTEFTCSQYVNSGEDFKFPLGMWIDGYVSHLTGDTTFTVGFIDAVLDHLDVECAANPRKYMLDAVIEALPL